MAVDITRVTTNILESPSYFRNQNPSFMNTTELRHLNEDGRSPSPVKFSQLFKEENDPNELLRKAPELPERSSINPSVKKVHKLTR